jgi:glycosyltransferase 2 family protein
VTKDKKDTKKTRFSRLWRAVSVLLACALLFLVFRGVSWQELFDTLAGARPAYVIVGCLLTCLGMFFRGLRWWLMLRVEESISVMTATWATVFGQMINLLIPGRGGDLLRVLYLGRYAESNRSFALGTTLTERVLDAVVLTGVALFAILWLDDIPDWMVKTVFVLAILCVMAILTLIALPRLEIFIRRLIVRITPYDTLRDQLTEIIPRLIQGLTALRQPSRATGCFLLTLLVWLNESVSAVIWAFALHLDLSLGKAIILNAILGLSLAAPVTPGGIGVYQYLAVLILVPFGFSRSQSVAYVVSSQMVFYVLIILLGVVALSRAELSLREARKLSQQDYETDGSM